MYYGGYYGMYWDPTYILVIIGMVICLLASARVKSTYAKFNRVRSHSGITAAEAAEKILHGAGIYDVEIRHISGDLTDNYDPSNRVLNLSDATFRSSSVEDNSFHLDEPTRKYEQIFLTSHHQIEAIMFIKPAKKIITSFLFLAVSTFWISAQEPDRNV